MHAPRDREKEKERIQAEVGGLLEAHSASYRQWMMKLLERNATELELKLRAKRNDGTIQKRAG